MAMFLPFRSLGMFILCLKRPAKVIQASWVTITNTLALLINGTFLRYVKERKLLFVARFLRSLSVQCI